MIVEVRPRLLNVLHHVWKPLAALFIWDCVVTIMYYVLPFTAPALPSALLGSALALFLGFRANSAYQRWWEGRMLWGLMINASRNVVRVSGDMLTDPRADALKRAVALRQIAYVNAVRCQLRRLPIDSSVTRHLAEGDQDPALKNNNVANGLLNGTGRQIAGAVGAGWMDTIQQTTAERVLIDIANAQGGMERLKNTPLPAQYRFYPNLFTRLFCLLLPIGLVESLQYATPIGSTVAGFMFLAVLRIGDELVDPFSTDVHGLPLDAMCRTIEIDALDAIGEPAPEPARPVDGVLW